MDGNLLISNAQGTDVVVEGEGGVLTSEQALKTEYLLAPPVLAKETEVAWLDVCRRLKTEEGYLVSGTAPIKCRDPGGKRTRAFVVENGQKVVLCASLLDAHVLVVRRGGRLILCPPKGQEQVVRVENVLVESGGLLQAGSATTPLSADQKLRFKMSLNPGGYKKCPVLASEYSYRFYCPGTERVNESSGEIPKFTGIDGTQGMLMNTFGPRSFGVGFNGRVELFGVPKQKPVTYHGTWTAVEIPSPRLGDVSPALENLQSSDVLDLTPPGQHFMTENRTELQTAYNSLYLRYVPVPGAGNERKIRLLSERMGAFAASDQDQVLSAWRPGESVLLTYQQKKHASDGLAGSSCVPASWANKSLQAAVGAAAAAYFSGSGTEEQKKIDFCRYVCRSGTPPVLLTSKRVGDTGLTASEVENLRVAGLLKEIYSHNGIGEGGIQQMTIDQREGDIITFKEQFFFALQPEEEAWYAMDTGNSDGKTTLIAAAPHAALVTRNIVIEPEFQGENPQGSEADDTGIPGRDLYRGPGGRLVPDYSANYQTVVPNQTAVQSYLLRDRLMDKYFNDPKSLKARERDMFLGLMRTVLKKDPSGDAGNWVTQLQVRDNFTAVPDLFGLPEEQETLLTELGLAKKPHYQLPEQFRQMKTTRAEELGMFAEDKASAIQKFLEWYDYDYSKRTEAPEPAGCWQLETHGKTGTNCILGAHSMVRYGASVRFDGVAFKRMGIPGNSGNIGEYALHFHMSGWGTSFEAYTPATPDSNGQAVRREHTVENCVFLQTPSRAVNLHGALEVQMRNNVSFLNYGSSWFMEEGVERHNTIEHNLAVNTIPCRFSPLDNSARILPNAAFDFNAASVFWLKHNQNTCARNVIANCPRCMTAIWPINQSIAKAKNIASVCLGDAERLLPAIGSSFFQRDNPNATTNNYLSYAESSADGRGVPVPWTDSDKKTTAFVDRSAKPPTTYFPANWKFGAQGRPPKLPADAVSKEGNANCMTDSNTKIPAFRVVENVCYGVSAYFNSYIGFYPGVPFPFPGEAPVSRGSQSNGTLVGNQPLLIPFNGPNTSSDQAVVEVYAQQQWFGGAWKESYPLALPKALSDRGVTVAGNTVNNLEKITFSADEVQIPTSGTRGLDNAKGECIPLVLSGHLVFGTTDITSQVGATVWNKSQSAILINCCHVGPRKAEGLQGFQQPRRATAAVLSFGDDINRYENSVFAFHNLICDDGTNLLPSATVYSGSRTRLGRNFNLFCYRNQPEYVHGAKEFALTSNPSAAVKALPIGNMDLYLENDLPQPVKARFMSHSNNLPDLLLPNDDTMTVGTVSTLQRQTIRLFFAFDENSSKWKTRTMKEIGEGKTETGAAEVAFKAGEGFLGITTDAEKQLVISALNGYYQNFSGPLTTNGRMNRFLRNPFFFHIQPANGNQSTQTQKMVVNEEADSLYGFLTTRAGTIHPDLQLVADAIGKVRPGIVWHTKN